MQGTQYAPRESILCMEHFVALQSLASFSWDIGKECRPDQTPQNAASDQGLHSLLSECSIKFQIIIKNTALQPLKRKWTGPVDNGRKFTSP